jgi:squalene synthase HpnC
MDQSVSAAYAECRRLARRHYENFPVASYLVPRAKRNALAAVYAFARCADDFADEPGVERRLEALADWRQRLRECYRGDSLGVSVLPGRPSGSRAKGPDGPGGLQSFSRDSVFIALGDAVREFGLSQTHFENLLRAFELDVRVNRHQDFESLLAYCTCSANPVGRLVLELFGHREEDLFALSDSICTALQLANFWQDVAVDLDRDRIYLPMEDLARSNIALAEVEAMKLSGSGNSPGGVGSLAADDRWRRLMAFEVQRTRELFERGRPLPERVTPELRHQLRLTWLGGMTILEKIEAARYDVFLNRPKLTRTDVLRLYLRARLAPSA